MMASVGLYPHHLFREARPPVVAGLLSTAFMRWALRGALRRGYARAGFPASLSDGARVLSVRQAGAVSFSEHRENITSLRCPVGVAWTEDDRLIEVAVQRDLAHQSPAGPRHPFETGGHNLQKTRAAELAGALCEMVEGLEAQR